MPLIRRPGSPAEPPQQPGRPADPGAGPDERRMAARALAERPDGASLLAAELQRERDPRVLEAIFSGLARAGAPQAIDAMVHALSSDEAVLRTGAMDALRTAPGAVAARLPSLLADKDADVRLLACDLARAAPSEIATPLLCARLEAEPEVNVCAAAVETLAEIGDAAAVAPLDRCAHRFPHEPFLRFAIAEARRRLSARPAGRRG